MKIETKFHIRTSKGTYKIKASIEEINDNRLQIKFPYNAELVQEIKCMTGARWNPEGKFWTIANNQHNKFQLSYLQGLNPYAQYDKELIEIQDSPRNLYGFQVEGIRHILTRKQCLLAYDCGLGKTLIAFEVLERLFKEGFLEKVENIIWVGPNSALISINYEKYKWNCQIKFQTHTYDSLKKFAKALDESLVKVPKIIIFDEIQKLKNHTTQRTQAAQFITDKMRYEYEDNCFIVGMSGTPSPHSPADWWSICEIIRPGFLKEGDARKFQRRIGIVKTEQNNVTGGMYPKLVTWLDNPNKCKICGKFKESFEHDELNILDGVSECHTYQKSINEVEQLYKRMKGLLLVKFKKDVLSELPDKVFRIIECKVSDETRHMANMIIKTSPRAIEVLTLLRELSDGFQYTEDSTNKNIRCELCKGAKTIAIPEENTICPHCNGTGEQKAVERKVIEIPTPKDDVLLDLLEEYEDIGRVVIGAAFTGTIDKIIRLVKKKGWHYIRVDGRGWDSDCTGFKSNTNEMLKIFQDYSDLYPKVAWISNPGSGGTGLNLTASPVVINYSNSFKAEDRMQFIERIHRIGMDENKGATIIDLVHLETDRKVLENLEKKKDLQNITLGDISSILEQTQSSKRYF